MFAFADEPNTPDHERIPIWISNLNITLIDDMQELLGKAVAVLRMSDLIDARPRMPQQLDDLMAMNSIAEDYLEQALERFLAWGETVRRGRPYDEHMPVGVSVKEVSTCAH